MVKRRNTFILTNHATKRMVERDIPHPHELGLIVAKKKTKRLIMESCPTEGFNEDYIYWNLVVDNTRIVFVCVPQDISVYLVITAFKYALNTNNISKIIEK